MRPVDWIILAAVLVGAGLAVFFIVRNRRKGGCCGDCSSCANCDERKRK